MFFQEFPDNPHDFIRFVLKHIMAGVFECMGFGMGKPAAPFVKIGAVEHKIAKPPQEEHGDMGQIFQFFVHAFDEVMTRIFFASRNVLNEFEGRDSVILAIVGRGQPGFHVR